eukprot:4649633-Amphidinium_carterae.1
MDDPFSWWKDESDNSALTDGDLIFGAAPRRAVSLDNTLMNAGVLHILHNASWHMATALGDPYATAVRKLAKVCKLLRSKETQDKLLQRCFDDEVAQQFHVAIKGFHADVHEKRWASVDFALPEVLALQAPLRRYWRKGKFLADDNAGGTVEETEDPHGVVNMSDAAIHDEEWYSNDFPARKFNGNRNPKFSFTLESQTHGKALYTGPLLSFTLESCIPNSLLESLSTAIRCGFTWAEQCPCHEHVWQYAPAISALDSRLGRQLKKSWQSCPLRGCRGPELASGELLQVMQQRLDQCLAEVSTKLSRSLSVDQRQHCISTFISGRSHLLFYLAFKLSHYTQPPWLLYKLASFDEQLGRRACDELLQNETCQHPKLLRLKAEPLLTQAQKWVGGESLAHPDMAELRLFVSAFRFAWTAERNIEGQHRSVKQRGAKAPNHSPAYVSYGLRCAEIKQLLQGDGDIIKRFAEHAYLARSRPKAVAVLGMTGHQANPMTAAFMLV